jgi:DNA mismatch repair protein MutS
MGSFLNNKTSKYNPNIRIIKCQVCNAPGDDVHHIKFQCTANENNLIDSKFHKNEPYNLVSLCKKCHQDVHKNVINIEGYRMTESGLLLIYKYHIKYQI